MVKGGGKASNGPPPKSKGGYASAKATASWEASGASKASNDAGDSGQVSSGSGPKAQDLADPQHPLLTMQVDHERVEAVRNRIMVAKEKLGLKGTIAAFGSHVNGFQTTTSDYDLSYMTNQDDESAISLLQRFASELPRHGFREIITIFQASVPLLKAIDPTGAEVDLCVGNRLAEANSRLIASYCNLHDKVGQLGRLIKHWAKSFELVGSSDGHLNSYGFTLMTIFYLMNTPGHPPIVPNLQYLAEEDESVFIDDTRWGTGDKWDTKFWEEVDLIPQSKNNQTVEELLIGMFQFYTKHFNWEMHAVSIRLNRTPDANWPMDPSGYPSKFGLYTGVTGEQWYVEDPFDLKHNLAAQCTKAGRDRIMNHMKETLQVLETARDADNDIIEAFVANCDQSGRGNKEYMLKCRVQMEKVKTRECFIEVFNEINVEKFDLWYPCEGQSRLRDMMDAFLIFSSERDRRLAHTKNESYVGEWQLRLLPCASWALEDCKAQEDLKYECTEVKPTKRPAEGAQWQPEEEAPLNEEAEVKRKAEEYSRTVRDGLRCAMNRDEVEVLVERARALNLPHEEQMGLKKLSQFTASVKAKADAKVSEEPSIQFQ